MFVYSGQQVHEKGCEFVQPGLVMGEQDMFVCESDVQVI